MKTVAVMRPKENLPAAVEVVESLGLQAVAVPMIEIEPIRDEFFDGFQNRVLKGEADIVIFTSANGVKYTLKKIEDRGGFVEALKKTRVVAIGPKTRESLERLGIKPLQPGDYSSRGIVDFLGDVRNKTIEIARSSHGSPLLIQGLRERGGRVHETQVYRITTPRGEEQRNLVKKTLEGEIDIFAFTSSMMARNFLEIAGEMNKKNEVIEILNARTVAAIGIPTRETLEKEGVKVKIMPEKFTFQEMIKEIARNS